MHKQYIRDNKRRPIGVMVAQLVAGKLQLGWSMHTNQKDYDKEKGLDLARARMRESTRSFLKVGKPSKKISNLPHSARKQADKFIDWVRKAEQKRIGV